MKSTSKRFRINRIDIAKSARDGATAVLASLVTSLLLNLQPIQDAVIPVVAEYFGLNTASLLYPLLTAILTTVFVLVRRALTNYEEKHK
jgi:hypothetical protein